MPPFRYILYFFALIPLVLPGQAAAEETVMTLPQVMDRAMQYNMDLQALSEQRGSHEAAKISAGLLPNPILQLDASTGALSGSPDERTISIGIFQEFNTAGKRRKRIAAAEERLASFDQTLADRGRLLAKEVKEAFYEIIMANKRRELAEQALALNNRLLEIAKERVAVGEAAELEAELAAVEVARAELRLLESGGSNRAVKARLLALAGLPAGTEATFAGEFPQPPAGLDPTTLKAYALQERSNLKALAADERRASATVTVAEAERVPNITGGLSIALDQGSDKTGFGEEKETDVLLGVSLSVPLPLFNRNQGAIGEARAVKSSAAKGLAAARRDVEREVEEAWARYETASKTASAYSSRILPKLQENIRLIQEAYGVGELGITAVIEEQKKFYDIHDQALAAQYNRQLSLIALEAAIGGDIPLPDIGGNK